MKRPTLILGFEPRITVPVARSLARYGVPVDVAGNESGPALSSKAVRKFVRLPSPDDQPARFAEAICDLIRSEQYDLLIPTTDAALSTVAANYDLLSALLSLACPRPEIIERVLNKELTLEIARKAGICVPASCRARSAEELDALRSQLRFPVIVKPFHKSSEVGFKVRYFQDFDQLRDAFAHESGLGGSVIIQEYCPGDGVGIETMMYEGQPLVIFQHRRIKEVPASGGASVVAIAEEADPELAQAAIKLLRAMEWEGVAMVEFRFDRASRRVGLMEVNGRFWGTLALPMHAGIDFPLYTWQVAHGQTPGVPDEYKVGTRWRWTAGYLRRWHGLLASSVRHPSQIGRLLPSFSDLAGIEDSLSWGGDPAPARQELLREIRGLISADVKAVGRRILPKRLVSGLKAYRNLGHAERSVYAQTYLARSFGLRKNTQRRVPKDAQSFLFLCHGNIMRSPMSERLLKRSLDSTAAGGKTIASAGLHATPGKSADPRALHVSPEFGISLQDHHAQAVTKELVKQSDAIFIMDFKNEVDFLARFPESESKMFFLSAYSTDPEQRGKEIPDPYFGNEQEVRSCYTTLQDCIRELVRDLSPTQQQPENELIVNAPAVR